MPQRRDTVTSVPAPARPAPRVATRAPPRGRGGDCANRGRRARRRLRARAETRLAIEIVGPLTNRAPRFRNVTTWPETLAHFDDLAFLFASNQLDHAIALLSFREAAYLYRLAQKVEVGILIEIGRFKGGGTLVLAAGMDRDSLLYSYDLHVKLTGEFSGRELDEETRGALERYGLAERVRLIVADSASAEIPGACGLVFVDGDHTYAGVRADYEHWRDAVVPGGHLLFHDAVPDSLRTIPRRGGATPL